MNGLAIKSTKSILQETMAILDHLDYLHILIKVNRSQVCQTYSLLGKNSYIRVVQFHRVFI